MSYRISVQTRGNGFSWVLGDESKQREYIDGTEYPDADSAKAAAEAFAAKLGGERE